MAINVYFFFIINEENFIFVLKKLSLLTMLFLYHFFYGFCWLLAFLPLRCLYLISDLLYVLVFHLICYRRKVVMENLRNSFLEKTERERRQIARKFYHFFCDLFIETIKLINVDAPQTHRRIRYSNPEIFDDLYRKGKQIFFIPGHYGNWEWLSMLEHSIPYHHASLYEPLTNKLFDKFFYKMRTKYGTELFPSHSVIRAINKNIQENRMTAVCFLSDQSPHRNDPTHYWTTFLNQDTLVYLGVEKLARRYNVAVVYYEIRRVKRGYYEIDVTLIT